MSVQKGLLLFFLLGALLLAGCQTNPAKTEVEAVAPPLPAPPSLGERWQASAGEPETLETLLLRIRGRELRRMAREGAVTRDSLAKVLARLDAAAGYTRQVREIVARLYGYRRAGGVSLETRWERELWQRLRSRRGEEARPAPDLADLDLQAARRSLAGQIAKAWFHERGLRELRQRAVEVQELYRQVLGRYRTSRRLERGSQDGLLAIRKELARAEARVKQLRRAENLAHRALVTLAGGGSAKPGSGAAVKPVPGGLAMRLLANRPDLYHSAVILREQGVTREEPARLLPDVVITTSGGHATRKLARWSRYKSARLQELLGLEARTEAQQEAVEQFLRVLHDSLKGVLRQLNGERGLVAQRAALKTSQQETRREMNRLRARYSARRADLTDILKAQIALAEIAGKLAYVQSRIFGQRLDGILALGAAGF